VTEFAALLGVSNSAVQARIKRGTLDAKKVGKRWRIPQSEAGRALPQRCDNGGEDVVAHDGNSHAVGADETAPYLGDTPDHNVDDNGSQRLCASLAAVTDERDSLAVEVEVLCTKLIASEQQAEHLRQQLDTTQQTLQEARGDIAHLQSLSTSQSEAINALTTELQGLTAIVHTHRMLDVPPVEEPKPGVLGRLFRRGRRRQVRVGHA
jgi:excisionase family DNA binding protein